MNIARRHLTVFTPQHWKTPVKSLLAFMLGLFCISAAASADQSQLYEKFDVLGALTCEIDGDIRLLPESERFLRCDYEARGAPGQLKRYAGYVRELKQGISTSTADFVCWTVLRLEKDDAPDAAGGAVKGVYASAPATTIAEFELKENSLVGGAMMGFALEPRCVAPRSGENVADKVLRFEISN